MKREIIIRKIGIQEKGMEIILYFVYKITDGFQPCQQQP